MARSQNGYSANDVNLTTSISVPGGKIRVRKGSVAIIMQYIAEQFHSNVEALKWPGNWGYAERPIRGSSTTLSNHSSGTAIDLNAPRHPLGKRGTFSSTQVKEIRKILKACEGVIRWGGDYNSRKDEMHFEINAGQAAVDRVAAKLKSKLKGDSIPASTNPSGGGGSSTSYKAVKHGDLLKLYTKGEPVKELQRILGVKADGYFGRNTESAVKKFQKSKGLVVDGKVGDKTWAALKNKTTTKKKPSSNKAAPKPTYSFPLPNGYYFGSKGGGDKSVSGYYNRSFKGVKDKDWLKRFANQLSKRGWSVGKGKSYLKRSGNDGLYGSEYAALIKAFQKDQKIAVDGLLGKKTWDAAFKNPVK